ncbi:MAG: hypothetical protein Q8P67_05775, partial [archaeon]|nr:hypothetical protein [archaeon]
MSDQGMLTMLDAQLSMYMQNSSAGMPVGERIGVGESDTIGSEDNNLRQLISQAYYKLRGVTEGWKFQFATAQPDVEFMNRLLAARGRKEYYFSCGQLLRYIDEEIAKLQMVFGMFDEKSKDDALKLNQLHVELHALRNYKTDYEANHGGFLKRIGNKLSGEEKLSAVERASLQRSILESNRLAKEATAERAQLQLEVSAMEQLNKRLQNKLKVAQRRIREAGISHQGEDSGIFIPPVQPDDPDDLVIPPPKGELAGPPINKFAPPSSSTPSSSSSTPPSSSQPLSPHLKMEDDLLSQLDALSPTAPTFKPPPGDADRLQTMSDGWTAQYGLVTAPLPSDFYGVVAVVATTARDCLAQSQAMSGVARRDSRAFGRSANLMLQCVLRLIAGIPSPPSPLASLARELAEQCLPFATSINDFLLVASNPALVFTDPP